LEQCLLIGLHTTFSYSDVLQGSVPDDADYWTAPLSFCLFINNSREPHQRPLSSSQVVMNAAMRYSEFDE